MRRQVVGQGHAVPADMVPMGEALVCASCLSSPTWRACAASSISLQTITKSGQEPTMRAKLQLQDFLSFRLIPSYAGGVSNVNIDGNNTL
jgi:hypothetical protein